MPPPTKLLLDTDVGTDVDDALAIGLAVASSELELRAVTTVSGDVHLRGRIAKNLLTLAGRADVPVAGGVREPLLRQRNFFWLGHEGRGIVNGDEDLALAPAHGVDLMIDGAFQLIEDPGAPELDAAVSVDAPRFVEFMLQRLERLT